MTYSIKLPGRPISPTPLSSYYISIKVMSSSMETTYYEARVEDHIDGSVTYSAQGDVAPPVAIALGWIVGDGFIEIAAPIRYATSQDPGTASVEVS